MKTTFSGLITEQQDQNWRERIFAMQNELLAESWTYQKIIQEGRECSDEEKQKSEKSRSGATSRFFASLRNKITAATASQASAQESG